MPQLVLDGKWVVASPSATHTVATTATTNAYVTLGTLYLSGCTKTNIWLRETNVNAVMYSIDGSMDNTNWTNLKTDQDIAKNASVYETLTDLWRYVRVQIIDKVGGTHGSVEMKAHSERM